MNADRTIAALRAALGQPIAQLDVVPDEGSDDGGHVATAWAADDRSASCYIDATVAAELERRAARDDTARLAAVIASAIRDAVRQAVADGRILDAHDEHGAKALADDLTHDVRQALAARN